MKLTLKVWRQRSRTAPGDFKTYQADHVSPDMSFLEMLDVVNQDLILKGDEPIAFDHDCREGICGACSLMINGVAHGPKQAITTCQLHMRSFKEGDTLVVEPWRAAPFPIIKDLVVDRSSFDRLIQAGGYISTSTGSSPEANALPVGKPEADSAMDAAACIGCGACVAACPNGSAMLFVAAKAAHLGFLPQGQTERHQRAINMVTQQDDEGFGNCTNIGECSAVCPKEISMDTIARLNRDLITATLKGLEPSITIKVAPKAS
jgi:succinate dehydrogenase / fumarate reductase, iron-sulfur subunit